MLWYLPAFQIRHIPSKPARILRRAAIKQTFTGDNQASLAVKFKVKYDDVKKEFNAPEETVDVLKNIYITQVAIHCGRGVAIKLLQYFPGTALHIPKKGRYMMLQKIIRSEFNGQNQVALAVKYGLSIACVYRYLKSQNETDFERIDGIKFKQLSLF